MKQHTYQERYTCPCEKHNCIQVCLFLDLVELVLSNAKDDSLEGNFPGIELDHLYMIHIQQQLVDAILIQLL